MTSEPERKPPLSHRETLIIIIGVLLPLFLGALSQTIAASALPTIGQALGATGDLSWVITAYLLTQTAATPLFGKFSDTHGRRATMQIAIWVFIAGSVACALAPNIATLVAARAIQGVAAGGLTSIPMTVLGDLAPPKYRARYYTYYSLVYITAGAMGPALGGFFAEYVHWSAIFWFGVPFALLALVAAAFSVRDAFRARRGRMDEMTLQLPGFLKDRIRGVIRTGVRARRFVIAAFLTGIAISFLELACTGQVYAPIVYQIQQGKLDAVAMLVLYNLAFITPLIVIFLLAYGGLRSESLIALQKKHTFAVKMALGVLFLLLAAFILLGERLLPH